MGFQNSISSSNGNVKSGGACLILFGLFFAVMGGVMAFFILSDFVEEAATYKWNETLCEIRSVEIVVDQSHGNLPFKMEVEYGYVVDGSNYISKQYTLTEKWSGDYEPLALKRKAMREFADGTICFVNPDNAEEAVVKREAVSKGLIALFPLVFVGVGVAILIGGIASLRKSKAVKNGKKVASISSNAVSDRRVGKVVLLILGTVFTLVGGGLLVPLGIIPMMRMMDSKKWIETPCEVIWSRVLSHRSDDSTSYSVDVFYKYDVDGVTHHSNRYAFMTGSSSGRSGKTKIIRGYPRGSSQVCFVNPEIPEQAILKSGFSLWVLIGGIPLIFFFVGIAMLVGWRRAGKRGASTNPKKITGEVGRFQNKGTRVLAPSGSRLTGVLVMLFVALFWNGIVSVFLFQVIEGFKRERPEWFLTIFMIPFVIVGVVLLLVFLAKLLSLANAKPVVTLEPGTPRLGEEGTLAWEIKGNAKRIGRFMIELRGVESATYRRGTNTVTDTEIFFCRTLVDSADGGDISSGRAQFKVPTDLVPTMNLSNNKISWQIKVTGDIPFFPDIQDSYDIDVLPADFS